MTCYVISCPSLGVCKIGYASDVARRFPLIRASAPAPVALVAQRDGTRSLEAAIHRALSGDRVHGEWFRLTDRTLSVFETTPQPNSHGATRRTLDGTVVVVRAEEPAATIIRALGGAAAVALAAGTAKTAPYRWQRGDSDGGTGGYIPRKYRSRLIDFARSKGVLLTVEDFAEVSPRFATIAGAA